MTAQFCDYCHKEITLSEVWDHGLRFHPDCFAKVSEEKMRREVSTPTDPVRRLCPINCDICTKRRKRLTGDWSEGEYET